jgi:hypothetical protein
MSARKLASPELLRPVTVQSQTTRLTLAANAVRIRKNGIEFRSDSPIPVWTEMTMALETPLEAKKLNCTGVVVACDGNRHFGYRVSMIFTGLSRQTQARLESLAESRLA